MPLRGWLCPVCMVKAPLDHFEGACPEPPWDDYWNRAIIKAIQSDDVHVGETLTPTTLLGCPRSVLISRFIPYYALPTHFDSPSLGKALHRDAEDGARDLGYEVEKEIVAEIPGIGLMRGRPDMIRFDENGGVIKDTKLTNQGRIITIRKSKDGLAKESHQVQLSFYRVMEQIQSGRLADRGVVNYACPLSGPEQAKQGGTNWVQRGVRFLTLDELLEYHPFEGPATVKDHVGVLKESFKAIRGGESPAETVSKLPLYGYSYIGGNGRWCQNYCEVNFVCSGLGGGEGVLQEWQRTAHFEEVSG